MKIKEFIGLICMVGGFVGALICAIMNVVFRFKNPDMTEYRMILENPTTVIIGCICFVIIIVGGHLFGVNNKRKW